MILTIDNLASRYHVLPSQAMSLASTFDLHVMDTACRYQRYQQTRAELEHNLKSGFSKPVAPPTPDQMQEMLQRVKERK